MRKHLREIRRLQSDLFDLQEKLEAEGSKLTTGTVNGHRAFKAASDAYQARVVLGGAEDSVLRILGVRG